MIKVNSLINMLKKNKCNFFTGVPDSVLKELSFSLETKKNHVIATSEGSATSIGIGYYLINKIKFHVFICKTQVFQMH